MRRVVSNLVANICTDARSAHKYYHFVRVMGRNPSHTVLEIALQTHATYVWTRKRETICRPSSPKK